MRAGAVKIRIDRGADMHHRRHVELDQLLENRIPPGIGQRRFAAIAAGGVGIAIEADESVRLNAALHLVDAIGWANARLRQLPDPDKVLREQSANAMDELVSDERPIAA